MVVHPAAGNWRGTLVNAVLFHAPDLEGVGGAHRPGIVHRLDKDTSGVILVAKNDASHRELQTQFKNREVEKTYLALVYGGMSPRAGEINGGDRPRPARPQADGRRRGQPGPARRDPLRDPGGLQDAGNRRAAHAPGLPPADRAARTRFASTWPTSIIPIVGDEVYGPRRKLPFACPRQFLHAAAPPLPPALDGRDRRVQRAPAADLQAVLDRFERALTQSHRVHNG